MTARTLVTGLTLALAISLPVVALAQSVQVVDAWSRPTPPGSEVGVAYFTVRNSGKSDRLLRVSSPVAKIAEMHVSSMTDGVMRMRSLNSVEIESGTPLSFEPNGRHVMLMGLRQPLREGEAFPLVLTFANAGPVEVSVRVRGADGKQSSGMKH